MQIKAFLLCVLLGTATILMAQEEKGMVFSTAKSWSEVLATAKAENKYIFVDAFTTWCGPCKIMAAKIFPQPSVGALFNDNYINIKVQLDSTSRDNDYVQQWYKDANMLMTQYNVRVFPTYLFFSPDGTIVHREVGSSDAETFIAKGKDALQPEKQYYTLMRRFEQGEKTPALLKSLSYAAKKAYDNQNASKFSKAYLATQKDMFTADNINFIADFTQTSTDAGFALMLKQPEKFDAFKEKGFAEKLTRSIIMEEEIYPIIFPRNAADQLKGEPDWKNMENNLSKKYAGLSESLILQSQIVYYQNKQVWPAFSKAITTMQTKYPGSLHTGMLNAYAWDIFENCEDKACVEQALGWSKASIKNNDDPMFLDTYANLLHKSGNTKDAIGIQKKAIDILKKQGEDTEEYEEALKKMEKGEKTWN